MVKKPKCVRQQTDNINNTNHKCCFCHDVMPLEFLKKLDVGFICHDCLDDYCEECNKIKPFITVRKDFNDKEHTFKQLCSDCYLKLCIEIVTMDKSYGIETIDEKKAGKKDENV